MQDVIFQAACEVIDRFYKRHDASTAKSATVAMVNGLKRDNLADEEGANRLLSYSETKYTLGGKR